MNPIGIMQGRLSPPLNGRIQSFPVDTWVEEFNLAREAGLDCIEWIFEAGTDANNPLSTDSGIEEIQRRASEHQVGVWSICADYYMSERLVTHDGFPVPNVIEHLRWLISRAGAAGARYIVLPFVDSSSLSSVAERKALPEILLSVLQVAEERNVELHLETDLPPTELVTILEKINHRLVRANYDIGNSASLGYDPTQELTALRRWLGSVHVKDRVLGGRTVPLGTGSADFGTCFHLIDAADFKGPFILQAAREEGISEVDWARLNRRFVIDRYATANPEKSLGL